VIPPRIEVLTTVQEVDAELERLGCDRAGRAIMAPKGVMRAVRVASLDARGANILKQELLAKGGECALPRGVYDMPPGGTTDCLILATERTMIDVLRVLSAQPYGLKALGAAMTESLRSAAEDRHSWHCGRSRLDLTGAPLIMGILNLTPDSFSDAGVFMDGGKVDVGRAFEVAKRMVQDGAGLLDVGGESTRPGAAPVDEAEELRRVLPLIERLGADKDLSSVPISIDTRKPGVARKAMQAGASIVNDIAGFRDPKMIEAVASAEAGVVVMHMLGEPGTMQQHPRYEDLLGEVYAWLAERVEALADAGVDRTRIAIDPGIGFGKTYEHNLELLGRLRELSSLGAPIVVGTSRKRFIAAALGDESTMERLEGTAATVAIAVANGARVLRVHDVKEMARVARVAEAIRTGKVAG
jgi:dihydropteroate synthase